MTMEDTSGSAEKFASWERSFREAAREDGQSALKAHLHKLDLPDEPELLLEGTIAVVQACVGFLMLDNEAAILKFLQRQQYDAAKSTGALYAVTFDIYRQGFGKVIVPLPFKGLDLADLLGSSWDAYKAVGYSQILISRIDGANLGAEEIDALEKAVTRDLFFDYDEEDLDVSFDPESIAGVLVVYVHET